MSEMAGKFLWKSFSSVNLDDPFFNSLKNDYPEFSDWFAKKAINGEQALVFDDEEGIGAFVYLKEENEPLELANETLPAEPRLKIGTLRLAERYRGIRLGEGALGVCLWRWQDKRLPQIYVTVFEQHRELIQLFERFGFVRIGKNHRGECVYLKSRISIDYTDPYKAFPFVRPDFDKAGLLPINDFFHDQLFPYSELKGNKLEVEEEIAGNGITKVFIATPYSPMCYSPNQPVSIYRIFTGQGSKQYKSVITSYCTITKVTPVKEKHRVLLDIRDFVRCAGNKTIFSIDDLKKLHAQQANIIILELIYNGFYGKGHNVTYKELKDRNLFPAHPYQITYDRTQFIEILELGDVDVQNVIID